MDAAHTLSLEAKHAGLDRLIEEEARRPAPDRILIAELKKRKLKLKEALVLH
jgi:hypothetical protein